MANKITRGNSARFISVLALSLIIFSAIAQPSLAQDETGQTFERDPEFEQEIYARLAAISPDAVPLFQRATQASDVGDLQTAQQGFERVLELAPDFPDALRRLSYVEAELGNVDQSVAYAQQAYALDNSYTNRTALARALLFLDTPESNADALTHAWAAVDEAPQDSQANFVLLFAGVLNEDSAAIRQSSTTLVQIAPDLAIGHFFAGLVAADDGNWEEAERLLLRAEELGMPAEDVQEALENGITSQARWQRWLRWGGYTLIAWLTGMAILFLTGFLLSYLTLVMVRRSKIISQPQPTKVEKMIRSIYRVIITISSFYFYVSVPFIIVLVLAFAGGLGYLFFNIGRIPIRLAIVLALTILYTLYAIVRSIFTRVKEREPGRKLLREEAPALWQLTEEVAQRAETRPIDTIYVTPGPEIAVTEQGGILAKLRDSGQRSLILGLGALEGLTLSQFKAIVAHEYGHFSNRDTAGGNLAFQVKLSMQHMAYQLASTGQAKWYNPAWLFVNGYYRIFLRITLGASRLQEILADRHAAMLYGSQNFIDGLKHIVKCSVAFNVHVSDEIKQATTEKRRLRNLYQLSKLDLDSRRKEIEQAFQQIMNKPTSPYDSHPAMNDRIAFVEDLNIAPMMEDDQKSVWHIIPEAESWQQKMTDLVQKQVPISLTG